MADALVFPVEEIPDADSVFMRAHETYCRDGEVMPGVFTAKNGGMSVDWDKYSTKEETRQRAKNPAKNGVLRLAVGAIRGIDDLDVQHRPLPTNRAHSEVDLPTNEELTEVRIFLLRIAEVVISLPAGRPPGHA